MNASALFYFAHMLRCVTVILVVLNFGVPVYMDYAPLCLIIETFTYKKNKKKRAPDTLNLSC